MSEPQKTLEERQAALKAIADQVNVCTACQLHSGRTHGVPGAGPTNAEIMFIGEGPGFHEDQQGLPFVGQSGKYLENLLAMIGLHRNQVFIANVVKCRPPENRDPLPLEIETCTKAYLFQQIDLIAPKVIVTLGRYSMGLFFPNGKITAIHGHAKWQNNRAHLPLFHPAAVLRNPDLRPQMEADMKKIPELIAEYDKRAQSESGAPPEDVTPPKQLSLF